MSDLVGRRAALKFAGVITLAAHGWLPFLSHAAIAKVNGYGSDPNLLERTVTWPRTLSAQELAMLAALCDIVLPAEPPHRSAKDIGVHHFLDEWVSAPYPQMQADRTIILDGLAALNGAARKSGDVPFAQVEPAQQAALFDELCGGKETVGFSRRLIQLICDGYYTTREGHAAIGYVGNVALASFPGAPPEIVRHLEKSLEQLPPIR
jgi:Gluconate 2-dehydrogenase subunit 3